MGLIVVGVDGSPDAERAFEFALEEARLRNAVLRVVHAWLIPLPVAAPGPVLGGVPVEYGPPLEQELERSRELAQRVVDDLIAKHDTDGVEIERRPTEGLAASALLEASKGADMLVVGSRGRGGFKGLLLGSVSQQLAQHASCPVVIVRALQSEES